MPQRFENKHYMEGFDDYENGIKLENCPYELESDEYIDYINGWNEGFVFWND
jgi:hypothetical protein